METPAIRWAVSGDANDIEALLAAEGLVLQGADWSGCERSWLVAPGASSLRACIMYSPGRPIARLDFLSIDKDVTGLSRVRVVRGILEAAFAVCALHGASFVTGIVPFMMPEYAEFLSKRGGKAINEGWLFTASLTDILRRRNEINGRIKNHTNHNGYAHP